MRKELILSPDQRVAGYTSHMRYFRVSKITMKFESACGSTPADEVNLLLHAMGDRGYVARNVGERQDVVEIVRNK